jgi:hypothetical protein
MAKALLQLALFVLSLLLLLVAWSLMDGGHPGWAVAIFVAMAGYVVWRQTRAGATSPAPDREAGSDSWRAKPDLLGILFIVVWLIGLIVASGALGNHRETFTALAGIGMAIWVLRFVKYRR